MSQTILHIDASARRQNSTTRALSARIVERFDADEVIRRDLSSPLPQITEDWVNANFTAADQRDAPQRDTLALSDHLVDELRRADTVVIGLPIYNFSVPASLKTWIDLIARAGLTFEYTAHGPRGLMTGKRAVVAISSGGTAVGSEIDFASGYIRHMLGFIGIDRVEFIAAERMAADPEASLAAANMALEHLAA